MSEVSERRIRRDLRRVAGEGVIATLDAQAQAIGECREGADRMVHAIRHAHDRLDRHEQQLDFVLNMCEGLKAQIEAMHARRWSARLRRWLHR